MLKHIPAGLVPVALCDKKHVYITHYSDGLTNFVIDGNAVATNLHRSVTPKMHNESAITTARKPTARSRLTNGSRVFVFGDGRSAGARRYRDLVAQFGDELGGFAGLPASAQQRVKRAAQTCLACEVLEARAAMGDAEASTDYARACNANRRALRDLEVLGSHLAAKAHPTLAEQLAAERRAREAQAEAA